MEPCDFGRGSCGVQAKSQELINDATHLDPVQQQKLLATVSLLAAPVALL